MSVASMVTALVIAAGGCSGDADVPGGAVAPGDAMAPSPVSSTSSVPTPVTTPGAPPGGTAAGRTERQAARLEKFCTAVAKAGGPGALRPIPYVGDREQMLDAIERTLGVVAVRRPPEVIADDWSAIRDFYGQQQTTVASLSVGTSFPEQEQARSDTAMHAFFDEHLRTAANLLLQVCSS